MLNLKKSVSWPQPSVHYGSTLGKYVLYVNRPISIFRCVVSGRNAKTKTLIPCNASTIGVEQILTQKITTNEN